MFKSKQYPARLSNIVLFIVSLSLFFLSACAGGQAPEASKARSRAVINSGAIVPAEEIRVAEYLRYYEQHFPEPETETVGLDLRLGNPQIPAEGETAWLQIGLQAKSEETDIVAPLNLALVIDRSGSMDTPDKMPYLKQSLRIFLQSLNPDDIVSMVVYSSEAEVILPAQNVGDGRWIEQLINRVQPGGGTNLHAGMMQGFAEVDKNFDIRRNNRVILLTDGMANHGITDPMQIARDALAYNEQGIYLSTIGLGLDFNDSLLSDLADQGQGGYSFVDSAQEMDRVFREHVSGLKQRAASDLTLSIMPIPGVELLNVSGMIGQLPVGGINIPLPPMGTGDSNVVLVQLQMEANGGVGNRPLAQVRLQYFDEFAQKTVLTEQYIIAEQVPNLANYDPTWDLEVLRNVTIQQTALGMQNIDKLFRSQQYEEAWRIAVALENDLTQAAQLTGDEQLLNDVALMQRYQQTLAQAVQETQNRAPRLANSSNVEQRPYRGRYDDTAVATPELPTIEIK